MSQNFVVCSALPNRDPVRMEGELGPEYNCMYNTKELKCKPRDGRDPISLQGDLGIELDPFHPRGTGLSRRRSERVPRRDPILGTGDFSSEPDPFPFFNGRNRSRPPYVRTDPITHSVPLERGSATRHSMRQFNERWIFRDPILHRYGDDCVPTEIRVGEMRHYSQPKSGNSHPYSSARDVTSRTLPTRRTYVHRNPITGEGMKPEDYSDLLRVPSGDYHFRNNLAVAHQASTPRPVSKSSGPTTRPTRSAVSPPARSLTRTSKSPMKPTEPVPKEQSVVKKVIRPKRPATVERSRGSGESIPDGRNMIHATDEPNGAVSDHQPAPIIQSSNHPSQPKVMSFFEEAQQASGNTWNDVKSADSRIQPGLQSTESVDYSESAQSITNGTMEELEDHGSEANDYNVQSMKEQPADITDTYRSYTPNLDRAATSNLFEELQAHALESQSHEEAEVHYENSGQQGTTAPLFITTGEEEDNNQTSVNSTENFVNPQTAPENSDKKQHKESVSISENEGTDDYISSFIKTQPRAVEPSETYELVQDQSAEQFKSLTVNDDFVPDGNSTSDQVGFED